jgi:hypothetical protein
MSTDNEMLMLRFDDKLVVDHDTALEVMRLLAGARAITSVWDLEKQDHPFPYKWTRTSTPVVASYISAGQMAMVELNSAKKD